MDLFKNLLCKRRNSDSDSGTTKKKQLGLLCNKCSDFIISSRTLPCGDSFCETCLSELLLEETKCPVCQIEIHKSPAYPCFLLDNTLELEQKSSEPYQSRLKNFKEFKKQLKINDIKEGMKVDVKDTEGIWCSGTIKTILNMESSSFILIHYDRWDSRFDEVFTLDSARLAPHGFYTTRNILRYRLPQNEGNRQAEVIR